MQGVGKPESSLRLQAGQPEKLRRMCSSSGRQTYPGKPRIILKTGRLKQVETQGRAEVVRGADKPIVVMNPQPVKAGNRPEDKTEGTLH